MPRKPLGFRAQKMQKHFLVLRNENSKVYHCTINSAVFISDIIKITSNMNQTNHTKHTLKLFSCFGQALKQQFKFGNMINFLIYGSAYTNESNIFNL
ncbi:hypothetical protein A3K73_08085 [Candidatus Pacearchaeota archaeon RBG_13_36_9]|nr:MAG: hypothetical protein A3K73_08085 [Candidatus Pacearchaeota archaeon RBG_13_36_9]